LAVGVEADALSPGSLLFAIVVERSRSTPKSTRSAARKFDCKCVTLNAYPAFVTADSWDVMIHICECGREHINESLIPPKASKPGSGRRRSRGQ
jgi:hypothetical protein